MTHTHTLTHTRAHAHVHTHTHTSKRINTHICIHKHTYTRIHTHDYRIRGHKHTHIHIYTQIHTQTHAQTYTRAHYVYTHALARTQLSSLTVRAYNAFSGLRPGGSNPGLPVGTAPVHLTVCPVRTAPSVDAQRSGRVNRI